MREDTVTVRWPADSHTTIGWGSSLYAVTEMYPEPNEDFAIHLLLAGFNSSKHKGEFETVEEFEEFALAENDNVPNVGIVMRNVESLDKLIDLLQRARVRYVETLSKQ